MNELTTQNERTLEQVASEIRTITASMLVGAIEIGRRMVEAKAMLPHGAFGGWIEENTGYSRSTANNFMRLFDAYGNPQKSMFGAEISNVQTFGHLSVSKALALLTLPDEEARETFVETHDVESMTTRELAEALKKADAAEEKTRELERDLEQARELFVSSDEKVAALTRELEELRNRPVDVAVEKVVDHAAEERLQKKLEKAEAARKTAEEAKAAAEAALQAEKDGSKNLIEMNVIKINQQKDKINRQQEEIDALKKAAALSASEELTEFKVHFEAAQAEINKLLGLAQKVRAGGNTEQADKLDGAVRALLEKTLDVLPKAE